MGKTAIVKVFAALLVHLMILTVSAEATLLARWQLDETSGTTIADSLGNYDLTKGAAGITLGSSDVPGGMPGTSVLFAHPNDLLSRPFTAALNPATFTVTLWAKPSSITPATSQEFPVGSINGGTTEGWGVRWTNFNGGNAEWGVQVGTTAGWGSLSSSSSFAANEWYHVAFQVVDNGTNDTARLFVNGALEQTLTGINFAKETNAMFAIGGRTDYTDFNGRVDDVQLHGEALSPETIYFLATHPNTTNVIPEPSTFLLLFLGTSILGLRRRLIRIRH